MRKNGNEFGSTTGRPRRCGWLDMPALKYAIMLNGVTQLIMMKPDVLSGFGKLKVCTHYKYKGETIDYMPFDIVNNEAVPVYKELNGWKEDISKIVDPDDLPMALTEYVNFIEQETSLPVTIVSVGPDRKQTLRRQLAV